VTTDPVAAARRRLIEVTAWRGDHELATLEWWRDAQLLAALGPGLAALYDGPPPTVVAGVQSSGFLLAPLVAVRLGVGMLGVQKLPQPDGSITLATAAGCPAAGERVLLVDDVVESAAQAHAVRQLVVAAGAQWAGMVTMVTYQEQPELNLRSLVDIAQLYRRR
jgi:adenine phosphoribosyltransferase